MQHIVRKEMTRPVEARHYQSVVKSAFWLQPIVRLSGSESVSKTSTLGEARPSLSTEPCGNTNGTDHRPAQLPQHAPAHRFRASQYSTRNAVHT